MCNFRSLESGLKRCSTVHAAVRRKPNSIHDLCSTCLPWQLNGSSKSVILQCCLQIGQVVIQVCCTVYTFRLQCKLQLADVKRLQIQIQTTNPKGSSHQFGARALITTSLLCTCANHFQKCPWVSHSQERDGGDVTVTFGNGCLCQIWSQGFSWEWDIQMKKNKKWRLWPQMSPAWQHNNLETCRIDFTINKWKWT